LNEHLLLALAAVIVLGIGAQWLAWRLRIASILLLLVVGFAAGPVSGLLADSPLLDPDLLLGDLLLPFVSLAVALILYEGGLTLRFRELGDARVVVWRLVTFGAAVTWLLSGLVAWLALDLSPALSILLGAVLVVTGPTVVIPLLREIRPSGRVGAILKWEGIVIDPIGAMLAVLVFEVILLGDLQQAAPRVAVVLVKTVAIGGGFGVAAGILLALLLRAFWIPDFLENAVSIMFVIGVYTGAQFLQSESGLLAAAIMGITLANQRLVDVKHIVEFKENLRVLLISSLFILLAARLKLEDLGEIGVGGLVFLLILVLVVRPLAVFLSTLGSGVSRRELAFLSVMAPRGIVAAAVASVFALRLQAEGYEQAGVLVPLTFLVIVGTVLFCSLVAPRAAHRWGVADPHPQGILLVGAHAWGRAIAEVVQKQGFRVLLVDTNRADLAVARMSGLSTYGESILAEHLLDEVDLGGLGRLIAATPNDWVNILAVHRFLRVFGRGGVYQVPPRKRGEGATDAHRHLHGRWLFDEDLTQDDLARRVARGGVVKTTPLTEAFTIESFRQHYGDKAIPLFVVTASKRLTVVTAEQPVEPKPGDTLISLIEAEAEE
jgi:NhaP-type Na+/H+ or K+/H+ antiporter